MEVAGVSGMTLSLVALPGLLASGIGALVFVGLDNWTGLGSFSLALTSVPPAVPPTLASLGWAVIMGVAAALLGWLIRSVALVASSDRAPEPSVGDARHWAYSSVVPRWCTS